MEGSETALECALRELREETGIRLDTEAISYTTTKLSRNRDGNNSEYFACTVPTEIPLSIEDNEEISEGGWYTLSEIQHMNGNIDVTNFGIQNGFPPVR